MAYRTLKRLLGETSLERKCRLLLGGGILCLTLISFTLTGFQTESLVWGQTKLTGQMLVNPFLLGRHCFVDDDNRATILKEFTSKGEVGDLLPEDVQKYTARLLRPGSKNKEYQHSSLWEHDRMRLLVEEKGTEYWQINRKGKFFQYLKAVNLRSPSCLTSQCHPTVLDKSLGYEDLKEGDLMAAVSLELPLQDTEVTVNVNRAIMLSFAIGTAILAMLFTYLMVRYVIVRPVQHLKDVSEEIAAGNMEIRADIQTGDEFQELSLAFNRMLRSVVSMQDELRRVNKDLDRKLDELARANMALFEMNRLKSDFLATVSHELRTPLNSIVGFGDLLAEVKTLDGKQQRWVGNIQTSGKLLLQMINDVLDLAKLEAGKMQLRLDDFSLRDVVESLAQMTKPLADQKNIAITVDVDASIPILHQDEPKLRQILSNLLSNAIKFTPEGGQISVQCRTDRGHVIVSVTDNGVGIAPEDQELIFEKFRQAQSGLTRDHAGTGLGLSIVRELTKLLGGDDVLLVSELGRGSTFTVRIPMHLTKTSNDDLTLSADAWTSQAFRNDEVRRFSYRDPSRTQ